MADGTKSSKQVTHFLHKQEFKQVSISKNLWQDFVTYQYLQHKKQLNFVLLVSALFYLCYAFPMSVLVPDKQVLDLVFRVFMLVLLGISYYIFFVKQKNIEALDVCLAVFAVVGCLCWLYLIKSSKQFEMNHFLMAGAAFIPFCANIKTRFRYAFVGSIIIFSSVFFTLWITYTSTYLVMIDMFFVLLPITGFSLFICWDNLQRNKQQFLKLFLDNQEKNILKEYNQSLISQAFTDSLTKMGNRRRFEAEYLPMLTAVRKTDDFNIAILILDIDFFKNYNDNYGHLAGDDCLVELSQTLKDITFLFDAKIYRFGGEEFVVAQKYNNKYEIINLARALIASVSDMKIEHLYRNDGKEYVTISIGGCFFDTSKHTNFSDILAEADKKLYQAKAEGKDTFVL